MALLGRAWLDWGRSAIPTSLLLDLRLKNNTVHVHVPLSLNIIPMGDKRWSQLGMGNYLGPHFPW